MHLHERIEEAVRGDGSIKFVRRPIKGSINEEYDGLNCVKSPAPSCDFVQYGGSHRKYTRASIEAVPPLLQIAPGTVFQGWHQEAAEDASSGDQLWQQSCNSGQGQLQEGVLSL